MLGSVWRGSAVGVRTELLTVATRLQEQDGKFYPKPPSLALREYGLSRF